MCPRGEKKKVVAFFFHLLPANKFKLIIFPQKILKSSLKSKSLLDHMDKLFVLERKHSVVINYS